MAGGPTSDRSGILNRRSTIFGKMCNIEIKTSQIKKTYIKYSFTKRKKLHNMENTIIEQILKDFIRSDDCYTSPYVKMAN